MNLSRSISLIFFFLLLFPLAAQPGNPAQADTLSLQKQFDDMVRVSNRYQTFRVVRQVFLNAFMSNVSDSIQQYTSKIGELEATIAKQEKMIDDQQGEITGRDTQINSLTDEKDSISFLGIPLTKATYNIILWSMIGVLLALLIFAFIRMQVAVTSSKDARIARAKTAEELEKSRKSRLEVEQTLRRQLQDERNKRASGK